MIVLHHHHDNQHTVVIDNIVSNGCETFHMGDLYAKCLEYGVSDRTRDVLLDAYMSHDRVSLSDVMHDIPVAMIVARNGSMAHLDMLVDHKSWVVRYGVAVKGHMAHLDVLVHDTRWEIRYKVSDHKHMAHLDILVKDKDVRIRRIIARHMTHLDILEHDPDASVRKIVSHQRDIQSTRSTT